MCVQDMQDRYGKAAQDLHMQPPMQVSAQTNESSPVYAGLIEAAWDPAKHIPETPTLTVWDITSFNPVQQFHLSYTSAYIQPLTNLDHVL